MNDTRTVTVVSPSNAIGPDDPADVGVALTWLEQTARWHGATTAGWDAVDTNGAAGPPQLRAEALMAALETSYAVFCAAGGDHAHEILEHLDKDRLERTDGWFVGTSDNSMLAVALSTAGATAFCGPDLKVVAGRTGAVDLGAARPLEFSYTKNEVLHLFSRSGTEVRYEPPSGPSGEVRALRGGDAEGRLVAVNLRCLLKLAAPPHWWPGELLDGAVLLLEGFRADAVEWVAMLEQLAGTGALEQVAAVGFGWLYGVDGTDGGSFDDVADKALELTPANTPVWRVGLFGHRCPHAVLPIGAHARLDGDGLTVRWPGC